MKLYERSSLLWWIIIIGAISGWFGSDDGTKDKVKTTAVETTRTVVEKMEKVLPKSSETKTETEKALTKTSHTEVARLKDRFTSAVYEVAVENIMAGNEPTLKTVWRDVYEKYTENFAGKIEVSNWIDDNIAVFSFGSEKATVYFDADVGMVRSIEPYME